MLKRIFLFTAVTACIAAATAFADIRIVPLLSGQLSLGRSTIGSDSPTGANIILDATPVLRFNDRTSLLPRVGINYNGIMSQTQIADYGSLYQQLSDAVFSLKLIHELSPRSLKFRAEGGYKKELARETRDEDWGKGLYDYDNSYAAVSLEKRVRRGSVGAGYRYSSFIFPNYTTLSSSEGQNFMGVHTFDNTVSRVFVNTNVSFSRHPRRRMLFDLTLNLDAIRYPDQKIVDSSGLYREDKRADTLVGVTPSLVFYSFGEKRDSSLGLAFAYAAKTSNQNYMDVDNLVFTPRYFDYAEFSFNPYVTYKFHPADWRLLIGYAWSRKNYADRLAQDANGTYTSEKTFLNTGTLTLGAAYPLSGNLELNLTVSSSNNSSNFAFEKYYRYNYTVTNVLLGMTYEL